jgi:hypothetical protein
MSTDCGIVISARDLFSPTEPMLANLRAHAPSDVPIIAVIGGAPEHLRETWAKQHGDRVTFIFEDRFLGQAEARNIGLRKLGTRLAVVMDNDNFVRPRWLAALLQCRGETGAMAVVPLVLERPRQIHCAGCDLYITTEAGKSYGHKVLRFHRKPYAEGANLCRRESDYGEFHTMLVEVAPTLEHDAFDEQLQEAGEVDTGLVWRRRAGGTVWCEPSSVVHFVEDAPIQAEDIAFYAWRWDMRRLLCGYRHFESKWGFDMSEQGRFRDFLFHRNARLSLLARMAPSRTALQLTNTLARARTKIRRLLILPGDVRAVLRRRAFGYDAWPTLESEVLNEGATGHPDLT